MEKITIICVKCGKVTKEGRGSLKEPYCKECWKDVDKVNYYKHLE